MDETVMCLAKILFNILKLISKTADLQPSFHDALKWQESKNKGLVSQSPYETGFSGCSDWC